MLATEPTTPADEKRTPLPPLETWASNDRMRHVPSVEWMVRKVDIDLRRRIHLLNAVYAGLAPTDPRREPMQNELRALCRSLERLAEAARHGRHPSPGSQDLPARIDALLAEAVSCLQSLDETPFGRRHPYHLFERSKGEIVYGALLAVITHVDRVVPLARTIDPAIDERLLEGLVVLASDAEERMRKPMA